VGIEVQGQGVFCNIQGNSVLHNEATNTAEQGVSTGIVAYNCIGSGIYGNVVQAAPWSMNSRRVGYSIYSNEKLNLRCNTSNRNFIGFRFSQSNLGIQVQSNTFGTHHNAMRFVGISHPYVLGGPIYGTNNTFPSSYVTVGGVPGVGVRNNSVTPSVVCNVSQYIPYSTTTLNASIVETQTLQNLICTSLSCLPDTNIHPMSIIPDSIDYRVSDDEYIESITNEALRRAMQMYLYRNIVNDSLLYIQIPQFAEFFDTHQESEFAQFVRLFERLSHSLDSMGNLNVDSTYRALIEELRMQLLQIAANNLPAIYERDVANIYLQYFTHHDDTLISTADIDRLIEIAGKCPILSGYAVYDAQAMLRLLNPEIEFDWLANCEDPSLRIEDEYVDEYNTKTASELTIYPNPAKDIISISGLSELCSLNIYSIKGELLKHLTLNESYSQFDVSDLVNGVYILKVNGQFTNTVKRLVIVK
jgi:hypothetical protein